MEPLQVAVRAYRPDGGRPLLDLLRLALGENGAAARTPAFWSWKHRRNPFGASRGLCAWQPATRHAVGARLFMRWTFRAGDGGRLGALRAVDTAIHPAYRRRGLFTLLTRRALRSAGSGAAFVFNTPNRASLAGYRKLGWRLVARWPLCFHVRRPERFAARTRGHSEAHASSWDACFGPGIARAADFFAHDGAAVASVVRSAERTRTDGRYRTPRTLRYLRWRYGNPPHLSYGVHRLDDARGLAGFVLMRPNRRGGLNEIVLTEMFLRAPDAGFAAELLAGALDSTRADYLVAHFAAQSIERRALDAAGFHPVRGETIPFAVRPLRPTGTDPLRARSWDLSLGDLEVF